MTRTDLRDILPRVSDEDLQRCLNLCQGQLELSRKLRKTLLTTNTQRAIDLIKAEKIRRGLQAIADWEQEYGEL